MNAIFKKRLRWTFQELCNLPGYLCHLRDNVEDNFDDFTNFGKATWTRQGRTSLPVAQPAERKVF